MRNDNNTIVIKTERIRSSSFSKNVKENSPTLIQQENIPDPLIINTSTKTTDISLKQKSKRNSPDEGIQSACETDLVADKAVSRSKSIEIINNTPVEIDITGDDAEKMPPPCAPIPIQVKSKFLILNEANTN